MPHPRETAASPLVFSSPGGVPSPPSQSFRSCDSTREAKLPCFTFTSHARRQPPVTMLFFLCVRIQNLRWLRPSRSDTWQREVWFAYKGQADPRTSSSSCSLGPQPFRRELLRRTRMTPFPRRFFSPHAPSQFPLYLSF